jgi:hypothetical protein
LSRLNKCFKRYGPFPDVDTFGNLVAFENAVIPRWRKVIFGPEVCIVTKGALTPIRKDIGISRELLVSWNISER